MPSKGALKRCPLDPTQCEQFVQVLGETLSVVIKMRISIDLPCTGEQSRVGPKGPAMGKLGAVRVMGLSRLRWPNCIPDDVDEILLIAEEADGVDAACSSTVGAGGARGSRDEKPTPVCWQND